MTTLNTDVLHVVVAGNSRQYRNWCHENGLSPNGPFVRYATDQNLRGVNQPIEVHYVGTWNLRSSYELAEIEAILRVIQSKTRGSNDGDFSSPSSSSPASETPSSSM
jgi:hypothetical protein